MSFFLSNSMNLLRRFVFIFVVTPLDVIKTRLQAQQKTMVSNRCFVYCNGLMDHLCPCINGSQTIKATETVRYTGMLVRFI